MELAAGARQGRLTDMAFFRRLGEVECPAHREKIADLLHFHTGHPLACPD
jgi:hypothetical protein